MLCKNSPNVSIELVHPWALSERAQSERAQSERPQSKRAEPSETYPQALRIGVIQPAAHTALPWNARRWRFALTRMQSVCDAVWIGDIGMLARMPNCPPKNASLPRTPLFAGYRDALPRIAQMQGELKLFPNPVKPCNSFSKFYEAVQRDERDFAALIGLGKQAKLL